MGQAGRSYPNWRRYVGRTGTARNLATPMSRGKRIDESLILDLAAGQSRRDLTGKGGWCATKTYMPQTMLLENAVSSSNRSHTRGSFAQGYVNVYGSLVTAYVDWVNYPARGKADACPETVRNSLTCKPAVPFSSTPLPNLRLRHAELTDEPCQDRPPSRGRHPRLLASC